MLISVFVIGAILAALSFTSFEIRKDITINANPHTVWKAIVDFKRYDQWNTQLFYLGGDVKPGGNLHLKLSITGTQPYEFKPVISHYEEEKEFAWLATTGMPRIFDGEHFFEIRETENGQTLVVNREEYRGILSLVIKNLPIMKGAPEGFEKMNVELKQYVETGIKAN